jgi:hypothetical protein
MNVEIGAEAGQFPEKEYINGIHCIEICTDLWQKVHSHANLLNDVWLQSVLLDPRQEGSGPDQLQVEKKSFL